MLIKKTRGGKPERFTTRSLKVKDFANMAGQMLIVPFIINEEITGKTYEMKYNVGFIGCDQNEKKEVFPVQAWVVSPTPLNENGIGGFDDPIPPKIINHQNKFIDLISKFILK